MVVNQLFIEKPPNDLLDKIIKAFGINDINDSREFTYIEMDTNNTLNIIKNNATELSKYYIPCKRKIYFDNIDNLDNKGAITIFRQLLKAHNYDLHSKEKFIKNVKYLVYKIVNKQDKNILKKTKKINRKKEVVIVFD